MQEFDDSLSNAEQQMAEHELGLLRDLLARVVTQSREIATEAEGKVLVERVLREDPAARELAERLLIMRRASGGH